MKSHWILLVVMAASAYATQFCAALSPEVEKAIVLIEEGRITDAEMSLADSLNRTPKADDARFALSIVQTLRSAEAVAQAWHRFGVTERWFPILGIFPPSVPSLKNPAPEEVAYEDLRALLEKLLDHLRQAERTIADISDPAVVLPLRLGMVRLDVNRDGKTTDEEALWRIYGMFRGTTSLSDAAAASFIIDFDYSDVLWLKAYQNLAMAWVEVILAHDFRDAFERVAHLVFERVKSPHSYLTQSRKVLVSPLDGNPDFMDVIALVHLIQFSVVEPRRLTAALEHLEKTIRTSREMWKSVLTETDKGREWIPNPGQSSVLGGLRVTDSIIVAWQELLDEAEALLAGKKLLPFWRGDGSKGVNLRRVFTEPRTFDLVLWVQGSAATPYLELGVQSAPDTWRRLHRALDFRTFTYAAWFN